MSVVSTALEDFEGMMEALRCLVWVVDRVIVSETVVELSRRGRRS